MSDSANQKVAQDFMGAFEYARGEVIAHQAKTMGPAFRMLKRGKDLVGVPEDCDSDAFAKCLVDSNFAPRCEMKTWTDPNMPGESFEYEECDSNPWVSEFNSISFKYINP